MCKLLTTLTAAAICLSGGIALASPSNIPIIHHEMRHELHAKNSFEFELSKFKLISGVQYDIGCHVKNENYAKPKNAVILKLDGNISAIRVNGVAVNSQFRVPQQDNLVQFKVTYTGDDKVTVINLDQNDAVILGSCDAIPTT